MHPRLMKSKALLSERSAEQALARKPKRQSRPNINVNGMRNFDDSQRSSRGRSRSGRYVAAETTVSKGRKQSSRGVARLR